MLLAAGPVVSKALPWLAANAPSLVEWGIKLYQGSRNAQSEMAVASPIPAGSSDIDPEMLTAAIKDIEASLFKLNSEVTDAGLLLTRLAESNAIVTQELRSQRTWLIALAMLAASSIALATVA